MIYYTKSRPELDSVMGMRNKIENISAVTNFAAIFFIIYIKILNNIKNGKLNDF